MPSHLHNLILSLILALKVGQPDLVPSNEVFKGLVANSQSFLPSAVVGSLKLVNSEAMMKVDFCLDLQNVELGNDELQLLVK